MNRKNIIEEIELRKNIRNLIKENFNKKNFEEFFLKRSIRKSLKENRKLISEAAISDFAPNRSTGINVLEDLLKKIIPVIEKDFKSLTTDSEQRESYKIYVLNGIKNILAPSNINWQAGGDSEDDVELDEDVDVTISPSDTGVKDNPAFIDVLPKKQKEKPEEIIQKGIDSKDLDTTGRNVASSTFKKIEQNILDSFDLLTNTKDRKIFEKYLIINLDLYFDKFEDELNISLNKNSIEI